MVIRKALVPGGWDAPLGDYRLRLLGSGRSVATTRLRIDWLRRFARAVDRGPWDVETGDVIARARLSPDWRVRLAVRLASELGLRRGEVAKVRGCDLVRDLHGWSLIIHGKGGKPRTVPVPESIAVEIQGHGPGWLFPGADSGHVSAEWIGRLVGRALPRGVTMHALRHSFAPRAYERTGERVAVQRVLGHESPQTTLRYLAIADQTLRAVVEAVA